MRWKPPGRSSERVLIYGPPKVGKSKSVMDIARAMYKQSGVWIIDTDEAWDRMLDGSDLPVREEWDHGERTEEWTSDEGVVLQRVGDWREYLDALERYAAGRKPGDWLLIDSMTHPWQWVQSFFIEQTHGGNLPEFLLERRTQAIKEKKHDPGMPPVEYQFINAMWFKMIDTVLRGRSHVVVTAEASSLNPREDARVQEMFGSVGMKPQTQKGLAFGVHSILLAHHERKGTRERFMMTTVGERGERDVKLEGTEIGDFWRDYMKAAGWKRSRTA